MATMTSEFLKSTILVGRKRVDHGRRAKWSYSLDVPRNCFPRLVLSASCNIHPFDKEQWEVVLKSEVLSKENLLKIIQRHQIFTFVVSDIPHLDLNGAKGNARIEEDALADRMWMEPPR